MPRCIRDRERAGRFIEYCCVCVCVCVLVLLFVHRELVQASAAAKAGFDRILSVRACAVSFERIRCYSCVIQISGGFSTVVESLAEAAPAACAAVCGFIVDESDTAMVALGDHFASIDCCHRGGGDMSDRMLVTGASGRLLFDTGDADAAAAAASSAVILVRRSETVDIRVDGSGAEIRSVTIGGCGGAREMVSQTRVDDRHVSLVDPVSAVYVVRAHNGAGQPFLVALHLLVEEPCPVPRIAAGGRWYHGPVQLHLLPSEELTANVEWPYACGTVSAVLAGSGHELVLPFCASALGTGCHEVVVTAALQGCVPTTVHVFVVVNAALAAPCVHVVYALQPLARPGSDVATTRRRALVSGDCRRFLASNSRMEVYVDDDAEGISLAIMDAESGEVFWRTKELHHGWADVSMMLGVLGARQVAACGIRVVASAPGCRDGTAGPFLVELGHKCTAPRFSIAPPALPKVFALSGTTIGVVLPDGGGAEASTRGLLILTRTNSGGGGGGGGGNDHPLRLLAQPDPRGIAEVCLWMASVY
jgi:hypothetical protein